MRSRSSAERSPGADGLRWLLDDQFQLTPGWRLIEADAPGAPAGAPGALIVRRRGIGRAAVLADTHFARAVASGVRPNRLPAAIRRRRDPERNRAVARLVLDGVLLVRTPSGDVTGPAALEHVYTADQSSQSAALPYRLTVRALRLAAALPAMAPALVASRLYRFHTLPRSHSLESRLSDSAAIRTFLGLERWSFSSHGLRRMSGPHREPYWAVWSTPNERAARYKLYVSPALPALPGVLNTLLDVLDHRDVVSLKVGITLPGLLRPDRLVVHFAERAHLMEVARVLEHALDGVPAHGVPLTAPLGTSGLLSWGVDPGNDTTANMSWRLWLSRLLAFALATARTYPARGVTPGRFALARLRLEGIHPATLAPTSLFSMLHGDASDGR